MNPPLATSRICGTRSCRMLQSAVGLVLLRPTCDATCPAHPTRRSSSTEAAPSGQGACWRGRPVSFGSAASSCLALSFVTNSW